MSVAPKFTPGPWQAVSQSNPVRSYVVTAHQYGVAMEIHGANPEQRICNARLIAAAPELYAELLKAVAHIALLNDTLKQLAELGATIAICGADYDDASARAALAKVDA